MSALAGHGQRSTEPTESLGYNIGEHATIHLVLSLRGGSIVPQLGDRAIQGFAAGGKIKQKIVRDNLPAAAYDLDKGSRLHITVLSPEVLARLTGTCPPPTPITMKTYLANGLPWFHLIERGMPAANNIGPENALANIQSLRKLLEMRREKHPERFKCSYCPATASYQIKPCDHMLCEDCGDGLPLDECPMLCSDVLGREKAPQADLLAENDKKWTVLNDCVIVLERYAGRGLVATYKLAEDDVSGLTSYASS